MREEEFTSKLVSTINAKFAEIMAAKPADAKFLNYLDALAISQSVRNVFMNTKLNYVPNLIEATLNICETVMSPTKAEKIEKIKKAGGLLGGTTGIAMIIAGIATALGWGASVIAAVTAFFVGVSLVPVIGWIAGGVSVAAIAGYFAFSGSDPIKNTESYLNAMREGLKKAMPEVWKEFGDELSND